MSFLAKAIGLKEPAQHKFDYKIKHFEKRCGGESIETKMAGKLRQTSAEILREIGFSGAEVLGEEAFRALNNKFIGDQVIDSSGNFWDKYKGSVIITEDGIISANQDDVENCVKNSLNFDERPMINLKTEIVSRLAEEYARIIPDCSSDEIKKELIEI